MFKNIKFVLIQTTHPGNIGAAARSIKNMGFEHLFLVSPLKFPDEEATARASGAKDILERAVVCQNLEEAIGDCQLVFGLSARERKIAWPILEPELAAIKTLHFLQQKKSDIDHVDDDKCTKNTDPEINKVAFVFGQEQFGLTNEQLEKCQYQIMIPANPVYSSLNLAQSIQIISYELRKAFLKNDVTLKNINKIKDIDPDQISIKQMEGFYQHLEKLLLQINFLDPIQSPHLMTLLRRLFNKANLDKEEMNILRGILTAVEKRV